MNNVIKQLMERKSMRVLGAVDDAAHAGINTSASTSPSRLLVTTLTDELKLATQGHGYVLSIAPERDMAVLSGGQKQRAAIARMLTQETPIMIFDDSLSAVDTQTDAMIRQAIAKKFGKASVILISHRITTLSAADKIIVLDHGRIVEEGTHEELKAGGGIYQKIYEAQSGIEEVGV